MSIPRGSAGVDVGATLAKVVCCGDGWERQRFPSTDLAAVRDWLAERRPERVAATGGGAEALGDEVAGVPVARVEEFAAWARGAPLVAAAAGVELPAAYLLVSLGTGTSVLAVRDGGAERVGGSALGGGTLLGLGRLLVAARSFGEIAELAARGDRRRVDLLVGDVYPTGGIELAADLNAASFGKLASTSREDLAHALMGLIGENVGIIATALSRAAAVDTIVYCGSTLDENRALEEAVTLATRLFGGDPLYLPGGAYCGAVGAAALAG
jgi:type II pantothenate kinase